MRSPAFLCCLAPKNFKMDFQIIVRRNGCVFNEIRRKSNVHGVAIFLAVSYLKK